ncbi:MULTISPECIES: hypothetical protein [unclassified Fusibacter]|uniref:hypothetical protein n=1 Tax=unclassified Fusibacter TaxID=2624464 RepID=UPI00101230AD|nr:MULTISPECIES: hypothetical protein [unclassified Fusibacter]MCK8060109.1 hypothetical protein [Fusibacter sp. A2]NPE22251.1 hypothetical protein [Fusibacter sp. A1]RXV61025.1 hypothetical protein DWB64_10425 [Fusibacter sp. A1]
MRKISALFIVMICLVVSQFSFASGNMDYTANADSLKELGLFNGTSKGYELNRIPNRVEGAVMLVRLLGKEEDAKLSNQKTLLPMSQSGRMLILAICITVD